MEFCKPSLSSELEGFVGPPAQQAVVKTQINRELESAEENIFWNYVAVALLDGEDRTERFMYFNLCWVFIDLPLH